MTLSANSIASLQTAIMQDLEAIKEWKASNKLTDNLNKSQLLLTPSKKKSEPINIDAHYNYCSISPAKVVKYLEIIIESDLNFDNHTKYVASKASSAFSVIYKIKHLIPFKTLLSLHCSLIHLFLLYGLLVWSSSYKTHMTYFTKFRKRQQKIIPGENLFDSSTKHFKKLSILKLQDLREVEVGYLIKDISEQSSIKNNAFFHTNTKFSSRTTRLV